MNQKGIIQPLLIVSLLIVGVVATVYLVLHPQIFKGRAAVDQNQNSLTLGSGELSVTEGATFTVPIFVKTNKLINLISASIKYPADLLELVSIDQTTEGSNIIKQWIDVSQDPQKGTASIVGAIPGSGYITQPGNLDTFTSLEFKVKANTIGKNAAISFDDAQIYQQADGKQVADLSKNSLEVKIPAPTPSASPTATPTVTPIPSFVPTPTPSPTSPICTNPATPSNLQPSNDQTVDAGQITLRWDNVPNITRYSIFVDDLSNGWNNDCNNLNSGDICGDAGSKNEYNFTVVAGHKYKWWLAAINDNCANSTGAAPVTFSEKTAPQPGRIGAMVMVDSRLYQLIGDELTQYITAAQTRRNFNIKLDNTEQLDDFSFEQIKARLVNSKNQNPSLEGVLFVGNIKMPTFYKNRNDLLQTEIFPAYYEDLDADIHRIFEPGTIDPLCTPQNDPNCNVVGNIPVPNHDFDYIAKGPNPYPELWVSLWPVGYNDQSKNNYEGYADQLRPYLQKLLHFYGPGIARNGKSYYVGNDPGGVRGLWDGYSGTNIDYYSISPDPAGTVSAGTGPGEYCLRGGRTADQCYVRAPTENYSTYQDFLNFTQTKEWMGENWQIPGIFKSHMQSNTYDFVMVNVHSWAQYSLISSQEARSLSNGGLVMMGLGCNVAEINQPQSSLSSNVSTYANENILLNYLYGQSNMIAAFGDQFERTHDSFYSQLVAFMKHGDYLGQADLKRKHILYDNSGSAPNNLRDNIMEVLYGDPFMDVSH